MAARDRGQDSLFVVNGDAAVAQRVRDAGFAAALAAARSWTAEDADGLAVLATARGAGILVVDSDLDPPEFIGRLRAAGFFCCAVEDNSCEDVRAHVLVNGDAHAADQTYRSSTGDTVWLLGPEFTPVVPGAADGVPEARVPVESVLLTLGGSDSCRLMPRLIEAIEQFPAALSWEVVIGPFTGQADAIAAALAPVRARVRVQQAPASMIQSIARCDVALTAAGQTLYELAAMGRPAVAISVAANQEPQLEAFVKSGAVISAGRAEDGDAVRRAVGELTALLGDQHRLKAMAAAGRQFVDGRGATRVIEALLERAAAVQA